jgi:hypothetical protein
MAFGDNGDSNCILTTNAINMLTYTLEPATIQPQTYVLPAPTIDWANTNYDIYGNLVISWFSIPNATYYKVFLRKRQKNAINKYGNKANVTLTKSLSGFFQNDSGPIIGNSYFITSNDIQNFYNNFYVFAYRNGVRSSFPSIQVFGDGLGNHLELWPVQQMEFHGGNDISNFTNVTARNLYTNQSIIMSSNEYINNTYGETQSAVIGTNTYLSNH